MTWFSPKLNCAGTTEGDDNHRFMTNGGGDAYLMSLKRNNRYEYGAWCDIPKEIAEFFICEGII